MPTFEDCQATCPTCSLRLEPMDRCSPGTVGVCPECGELVRRQGNTIAVYTDEEANEKAHPQVLAKLREIQEQIRVADICACPKGEDAAADPDDCKCGGGCGCHPVIVEPSGPLLEHVTDTNSKHTWMDDPLEPGIKRRTGTCAACGQTAPLANMFNNECPDCRH